MKLLCLALLVAVVATAQVQKEHVKKFKSEAAIIWSGNQIYDLCQHYKTDKLKGSLGPGCLMYITGAAQTLALNDNTETTMVSPCMGKEVTNEQITDVVIKWLDDHPETRDRPAPYLIVESLNRAFPCH
jgi:hypothetical protein